MADTTRPKPARIGTEPPRGMRDILPDEVDLRERTADTILAVYRRHGFRRVETPALDSIHLLTRGEGGENEKLIFKVLKRGEKLDVRGARSEADLVDLGLRFDLTVPLARYYAHNHPRLPRPLKAVQIGPVWRAERPQRGRYRQFTQCDIDILGVRSEVAEVELILATTEALQALGLGGLTVRVNDRRLLGAMARWCGFDPERHDSVFVALDKWDKLEKKAVRAELESEGHPPGAVARMANLFAEFDSGQGLDEMRKRLGGQSDEGAFASLHRILDGVRGEAAEQFRIVFDPTLVRGMSYYTGPIFEIASSEFPTSIAGGGRYDEMIGRMLGRDVPATGFSTGFEWVVAVLLSRPGGAGRSERRVALLFEERTDDLGSVLAAARRLRADGLLVSLQLRGRSAGSQRAALAAEGFDGAALFDGSAIPPVVQWFGDRAETRS